MKISLENFGPIHQFEFDLDKDIHLLYGKNSVGKSYAVYVVYLVVKAMPLSGQQPKILIEDDHDFSAKIGDKIKAKLKSVENQTNLLLDFTPFLNELMIRYLEQIFLNKFTNLLKNTFINFSDLSNENGELTVKITTNKLIITITFVNDEFIISAIESCYNKLIYKKQLITNNDFPKLDFAGGTIGNIKDYTIFSVQNLLRVLHEASSYILSSEVRTNLNLYFLPSSRSGLQQALGSFTPIMAKLSQYRHLISTIELPGLIEPVANYYLNLSTISAKKEEPFFKDIYDKIQHKILNGEIFYNIEKSKLFFKQKNNDNMMLSMEQVSSMIAETAPIIAFFKYIIKYEKPYNISADNKKSLLIIEEPEAHLHPEVQVKLMEIFSELPNYGIKIVMTSHSNYMFNKLSNMVLQQVVDKESVACYHLVMTEKGSVALDDMQPTEDGMEDHNFVETAEKLYSERLQIYHELNETQAKYGND